VSNAGLAKSGRTSRGLAGRGQARGSPASPAHGATVAFIVEGLREDILAGRLEPGSRLIENDLTLRFAVSRGPVREGLRRLSADGLIEHRPHRGAIVRRLTEREIRESIEPIYSDAPRNSCDYLKENAAFHDAVMTLADNRELRELAGRLQLPLIMAQVGHVLTPPVLEASVREHRLIAEAIVERDPGGAAARMRKHLERAAALALAGRAAHGDNGRPEG
jgi:DNA-binding GntR family transcriptional regulator